MGARVAGDEIAERLRLRRQQHVGQPLRQRHAERVAVACGVLDGHEARFTGDAQPHRTSRAHQLLAGIGGHVVGDAVAQLGGRQIADTQQEVVDAIERAGTVVGWQALQLRFERRQRIGVEQIPELRRPEQRLQLRLIDRQRLGPPLGQRGITVVEVVGDVAEQQRRGERRRRRRVHGHDADLA